MLYAKDTARTCRDYTYPALKSCLTANPAAPYVIAAVKSWPHEYVNRALVNEFGKVRPGYSPTYRLHQREAIEAARSGDSYVLTTGTGSGKSLSYIVPIVDRVLAAKAAGSYQRGKKANVVYPMNATANSQLGELGKFLKAGYPDGQAPVTFAR